MKRVARWRALGLGEPKQDDDEEDDLDADVDEVAVAREGGGQSARHGWGSKDRRDDELLPCDRLEGDGVDCGQKGGRQASNLPGGRGKWEGDELYWLNARLMEPVTE